MGSDQANAPYLQGLTVLDISQGIAGPYCGMILRQQGARVIKVEPPTGDWSRQMGRAQGGNTAISIAYNAGKESIVLDTRQPEGRSALRSLADQADVVIQNFRPGVIDRMGAGYAELSKSNPRLVYVSITGYGNDGPLANRPALDTTMQAASGLMQVNQDAQGRPQRIGFFLVDLATGLYAAQNVGMALYQSALNGRGRHIQVSMLQASTALQSYLLLDEVMFSGDKAVAFNAPTGLFEAKDYTLYISMLNDAMFLRLAKLLEFEDWVTDVDLHSSAGRMPRAAELNQRVAQAIAQNSCDHWEQKFIEHDILFSRVAHTRDLLENEQARHVGLFSGLTQPGVGDLPWVGTPGNGARQPAPGPAPVLGEHTERLIREFKL